MRTGVKNLLLIFIVLVLAVFPLVMNKNAEFGGADDQAEKIIGELQPDYQPWFKSVWEPPSGEIESLLFALQAALGAGFIGYFIGFYRGWRGNHVKRKQPGELLEERDTGA
ncbi:energy-coupling factor ABC transporter substrate-binding protein [Desulfofundulus thermosubterraneus]|uniref:Cobalt transport protein CbiN n=1 Tax=Desulfofundulus thermosubterraneus DSM 16057 TaxID=1121432 RepID=A0A1M6E6B7_9FIRM|nr:energy-coupling factor ABC transporter substrate-binding protein [Desulfofundulus thermosubterraneus]SHI80919.1 cobalt/nickel transport protein [Desulfofundulus thermosubterraneus DSM 16057]